MGYAERGIVISAWRSGEMDDREGSAVRGDGREQREQMTGRNDRGNETLLGARLGETRNACL